MTLEKLQEFFEDIAGRWDGDNPGLDEDNAHLALEALEHLKALKEIIEELNNQ